MDQQCAIELRNITKRFDKKVVANDSVSLKVNKGEILALLGENGSGKTTLMNIISGIYFPDEGQIFVDGKEVSIRSPKDSFDLGIGMIHQHFKLIDVMTAAENIILGLEGSAILNMKKVCEDISALVEKYDFDMDPNQKIYTMSVSQKQTVEIVKMLYRGAKTLILDEPTAVLTPQEVKKLFAVIRNMRDDGRAIIIITHKLNEVMEISDRVSILRKGKYIGTVKTSEATISSLTEMMVGEKISLNINRPMPHDTVKRLTVDNICCVNHEEVQVLDHVSFEAYGGEVLGIAGISGSGQKELLEAISRLQDLTEGKIIYHSRHGKDLMLTEYNAVQVSELGIRQAFVPEDRLGMGLVGAMGMTGNMLLRSFRKGKGFFTRLDKPKELAEQIKEELEVVTPDIEYPVQKLSGGNVQKILVGREISSAPSVLMVAYPVRGLDINSSYLIYNLLNQQKEKGAAVICVAEDLDMLIDFSDRILVLCGGRVTGIVDARKTTKEEIGLLMTADKEAIS
ncbi:MAG: ABC transporter ATP-binding protein [Eubacterium sp.]|nr:ABC transporter ATP-binding protein [Eubacterium sp.]